MRGWRIITPSKEGTKRLGLRVFPWAHFCGYVRSLKPVMSEAYRRWLGDQDTPIRPLKPIFYNEIIALV